MVGRVVSWGPLGAGTAALEPPRDALEAPRGAVKEVRHRRTLSTGAVKEVRHRRTLSTGAVQEVRDRRTLSTGAVKEVRHRRTLSTGTVQEVRDRRTLSTGTLGARRGALGARCGRKSSEGHGLCLPGRPHGRPAERAVASKGRVTAPAGRAIAGEWSADPPPGRLHLCAGDVRRGAGLDDVVHAAVVERALAPRAALRVRLADLGVRDARRAR